VVAGVVHPRWLWWPGRPACLCTARSSRPA
jgi:hypothetical protein